MLGLFLVIGLLFALSSFGALPKSVSLSSGGQCVLARPYFGSLGCEAVLGKQQVIVQNPQDGQIETFSDFDYNANIRFLTTPDRVFQNSVPKKITNVFADAKDFNIDTPLGIPASTTCYGRVEKRTGGVLRGKIDYAIRYQTLQSWGVLTNNIGSATVNEEIWIYPVVCIEGRGGFLSGYKYQAHPSQVRYSTSAERWVAHFDSAIVELPNTEGCVAQDLVSKVQNNDPQGVNAAQPNDVGIINQAMDVLKNFGSTPSSLPDLKNIPKGAPGQTIPFVQNWVQDISLNRITYNGQEAWITGGPTDQGRFGVYSVSDVQTSNGCFNIPTSKITTVECNDNNFCISKYGNGYQCSSQTFQCEGTQAQCRSDLDCSAGNQCTNNVLQEGKCVNNLCQFSQKSVSCCPGDYSCSGNTFCSISDQYTCQTPKSSDVACQTQCCDNYSGYKDKACSDNKQCIGGICLAGGGCPEGQYVNYNTGTCVQEPQCDKGEFIDTSVNPHICKTQTQDNTLLYAVGMLAAVALVIAYLATSKRK